MASFRDKKRASSGAAFAVSDKVTLAPGCNRFYNANGQAVPAEQFDEIFQKNHQDIVFTVTNIRGNGIELTGEYSGRRYIIWVNNAMIKKYAPGSAPVNRPAPAPESRPLPSPSLPAETAFPAGFYNGAKAKIKMNCRDYRNERWEICSIDRSEDIWFKQNYDEIIFTVAGCRGGVYLELTAYENGTPYDIYVEAYMAEVYDETSNEDSEDYYDCGEPYENEELPGDYSPSLDDIPISEYNYCGNEYVNDWCREICKVSDPYNNSDYIWTNRTNYQRPSFDTDYIDDLPPKSLCSMMYNDIFVPDDVKEKAFRRLLHYAVSGNAAALFWFGVTAYEGLAGRTSDKKIAFSFIKLAEEMGFRVTDGNSTWLKNPTSQYISRRENINRPLFTSIEELYTENDDDYYGGYDDDDDYEDDHDYDYSSYAPADNSFRSGDIVSIRSGTNRYWTDLHNKSSRVNGIPADYFSRKWTVVDGDGNKFVIESTSGFLFTKKTVRIVLTNNDISKA